MFTVTVVLLGLWVTTMARQPSTTNISERLNHVENEVVSIGTKVENIKEDVGSLVIDFRSYTEKKETNWATIAAWVGVAITCIGGALYHNRLTLAPLELQNEFQEKLLSKQDAQLERLETQVNELKNGKINPAL